MSAPPPPETDEPRAELVLVADASLEGEELGARLRELGCTVIDVPMLSLRAREESDRPKVVILDVDAPGGVGLATALLEQRPGLVLFTVGSVELGREVQGEAAVGRAFPRPLDVERLAEHTHALLRPGSVDARPPQKRSDRPPSLSSRPPKLSSRPPRPSSRPPMLTSAPSVFPVNESLPPPSAPPKAGDPLELGALEGDDDLLLMEGMIEGPIDLSPELEARLEAAERRVRSSMGLPSNAPPPSSDDPSGGALVPPELLAMLDEPVDESVDLPNASDVGGSAVLGLSSLGPGTGSGYSSAHGTGVAGTSSGTESGASHLSARGTSTGQPNASTSSTTRTGVEALLGPMVASASVPAPTQAELPPRDQPATRPPSDSAAPSLGEPGTHVGLGSGLPPLRTGGALALGQVAGNAEPVLSPRAESPATGYRLDEMLGVRHDAPASLAQRAPGEPAARREGIADTMRGDDPSLLASLSPLSPPVRFREPRALGGGRAAPSLSPARPNDEPAAPTQPPGPPPRTEGILPGERPSTDRAFAPMDLRVSPQAASVSTPTARGLGTSTPVVFGASEGLRPIARAITARITGSLAITTSQGLRRVILQEGDLITVGSEITDESLVSFLASRGDLGQSTAARLAGKLPTSGRHAGAALIAQGLLAQDDLWPVLRGHAEWLLGRALLDGPGSVDLEEEAPGRLRAEPGVFGGATGAEIFVEVARRVLPPDASKGALGGDGARFDAGPKANLLSECALGAAEDAKIRGAAGRSLVELVEDEEGDFVSALRALVELGILEVRAGARPVQTPERREHDPLDDEAIRLRVEARLALVQEGDYFSLLGVSADATPYEIKRAYLELRRQFEPSRLLTAGTVELASDVSLIADVLDEAYDVLRDTNRRERYRRAILAGPPG